MVKPKTINRLGIVKIPKFKNGNEWTEEDLEIRTNLFEYVIPITMSDDVKNSFLNKAYINIVCYCEHFREIKKGEKIPQYSLAFEKNNEQNKVKLLKIEEVKED